MTSLNSKLQLVLLNRKKSRNKLQKGFTLVELLIVVIILGVLSAVALPAFLNQTGKAKLNAATASVTAAAKACEVNIIGGGTWDPPQGVVKATNATTVTANPATCAYGDFFGSDVDGLTTQAIAQLGANGGVKIVQDPAE